MSPKPNYDFANQLVASKEFFNRSTRVLDEADSGFRPQADMMTVAQQVAHTAHHRGALTVYSRQLGKVPPMPYAG